MVPDTLHNQDLLGSVTQRIIAQPYRGRTLRVSTWLRLDARTALDAAQIMIGVESPNGRLGFTDERRVQSSTWQHVEMIARIDDDANYINIALVAGGRGSAWMDGVSIEEIPPQVAVARPLVPDSAWPVNLDFAEGAFGDVPAGWQATPKSAELRRDNCWSGAACAVILPHSTDPVSVLTQTFNGIPHRGKNFRLSARLRAEPTGPDGSAEIYVHVIRSKGDLGFRSGRDVRERELDAVRDYRKDR